MKAALGLIGNSLENDPPAEYIQELIRYRDDPHFEIWNHGYDHGYCYNYDSNHKCTSAEYLGASYETQYEKMSRTQQLAYEKAGITLRAFGAPGNSIRLVSEAEPA
jgi:hypothetical protein